MYVIHFCDGKAVLSAAITSVFIVTWSRNYSISWFGALETFIIIIHFAVLYNNFPIYTFFKYYLINWKFKRTAFISKSKLLQYKLYGHFWSI